MPIGYYQYSKHRFKERYYENWNKIFKNKKTKTKTKKKNRED